MTRAFTALVLAFTVQSTIAANDFFAITVVDEQTGRGVPLVELETVNNIVNVTDSNGVVAFFEPGLMGQSVFFHVRSHGYEFPKDGFGIRGKALAVTAGGSATLKIKRNNIAERLYRVTGAGIYRDTVLLGKQPPVREPLLNGLVLGSDSVVNAVYRGKIHWFWGDTNRAAYPLGLFHVPGATSELPTRGGLDPSVGVDLTYFVDDKGFARATANMPGDGPTWIGGLVVLKDNGSERMFARYVKVKPPLSIYEQGLVEYIVDSNKFEKVTMFDKDATVIPDGHPFLHTTDGVEYVYFATPYPLVRVRANTENFAKLSSYEAYTCLKEGSTLGTPQIDRGSDGRARYAWRKNAPAIDPAAQKKLIDAGHLKSDETLLQLRDRETGKPVFAHAGSVNWNAFRKKWVMITAQQFGTSLLGETWFAEAETPVGPWKDAVKIVSHEKYSFYNPKQHPMFDQDGGRVIYFEGTYTHTFSGNPHQTPRYDYNQIMYRLDLSDPRL